MRVERRRTTKASLEKRKGGPRTHDGGQHEPDYGARFVRLLAGFGCMHAKQGSQTRNRHSNENVEEEVPQTARTAVQLGHI